MAAAKVRAEILPWHLQLWLVGDKWFGPFVNYRLDFPNCLIAAHHIEGFVVRSATSMATSHHRLMLQHLGIHQHDTAPAGRVQMTLLTEPSNLPLLFSTSPVPIQRLRLMKSLNEARAAWVKMSRHTTRTVITKFFGLEVVAVNLPAESPDCQRRRRLISILRDYCHGTIFCHMVFHNRLGSFLPLHEGASPVLSPVKMDYQVGVYRVGSYQAGFTSRMMVYGMYLQLHSAGQVGRNRG